MGDLPVEMNRLAGTTDKDEVKAANIYAGTSVVHDEVLALNKKLGTTGLDLPLVLSRLANTTTTDAPFAATKLSTAPGASVDNWLLEGSTDGWLLEDGSGVWLLES